MPRPEAERALGLKNFTLATVAAAGAMRYVIGPERSFPARCFFFLREDVTKIKDAFEKHYAPVKAYSKPGELIALRHAMKNYLGRDSGLAAVVRAVVDGNGVETGMFEIPAGGRRFRALELLAKQKRLAKTAPVPCVVREGGLAEEDSLAENIQRAPLHPLDQFRAFLALREKGQSEEEIAAAFFVSVNVVKQLLKLASVSPRLLDIYAEDGLSLDQLMAFTVSGDQ